MWDLRLTVVFAPSVSPSLDLGATKLLDGLQYAAGELRLPREHGRDSWRLDLAVTPILRYIIIDVYPS